MRLKELRPFYPAKYCYELGEWEKAKVMVAVEVLAIMIMIAGGAGFIMAKEGVGVGAVGAVIYLLERLAMAEDVRRDRSR